MSGQDRFRQVTPPIAGGESTPLAEQMRQLQPNERVYMACWRQADGMGRETIYVPERISNMLAAQLQVEKDRIQALEFQVRNLRMSSGVQDRYLAQDLERAQQERDQARREVDRLNQLIGGGTGVRELPLVMQERVRKLGGTL